MIAVEGKYKNGKIELLQPVDSQKSARVIVTFLDDDIDDSIKKINVNNFNFSKSRKVLKNVTSNFSDAVCEERRLNL